MWHPSFLARVFHGDRLNLKADYYAGCHESYERLNSRLPDLDSPVMILDHIEGLDLNQLNHRLCCTKPKQIDILVASIKNRTIITPCYGCIMVLREALEGKGDYRVAMLEQVAWAAVSSHSLRSLSDNHHCRCERSSNAYSAIARQQNDANLSRE